jgi:hypothetical protein
LSKAKPYFPTSQPIPPPSVRPATLEIFEDQGDGMRFSNVGNQTKDCAEELTLILGRSSCAMFVEQ